MEDSMMIGRYEAKKDCFAYNGPMHSPPCEALGQLFCLKEAHCPFYKTGTQEVRELRKYNGVWTVEDAIREYSSSKAPKRMKEGGLDGFSIDDLYPSD